MNNADRFGYRGYVASRPVRGISFPQQVQNLVVRDYASRWKLHYLLSATEYAMPSCYLMLNAVLDELPTLKGVILFSAFMLPKRKAKRLSIYEKILGAGCELHAALENLKVQSRTDVDELEDVLEVALTLPSLPLEGRYEKGDDSADRRSRDPFWSALIVSVAQEPA